MRISRESRRGERHRRTRMRRAAIASPARTAASSELAADTVVWFGGGGSTNIRDPYFARMNAAFASSGSLGPGFLAGGVPSGGSRACAEGADRGDRETD